MVEMKLISFNLASKIETELWNLFILGSTNPQHAIFNTEINQEDSRDHFEDHHRVSRRRF